MRRTLVQSIHCNQRTMFESSVEKYVIIPLYRGYETLGISERSDGIVHDATRQVENYDK
jgi:hypothetical protein